ncbi:Nramp family divalent metal transporter [Sulfidibacter corallicola]|uniref:Nramp family divalent metal transporter n=1 Tax=Sulfidibacter corallicola TaxID=2818388 RepID=A0A8A4TPD4_SULCO|nr:Nramp family divalent metal transporter [Sulfidibacter corallicola]QTD50828.1 Nramp family divalent metal transporter [Sulfidibacter corallicola]
MSTDKKSALLGPGLILAATGVGAGDLIAASVTGARYGTVLLWSAVVGALVKFVLNEGLARRQLRRGDSFLHDLCTTCPRWITWYFGAYLVLWSFVVAGALAAACGLAAHALVPAVPVWAWGIVHAVVAWVLVWFGRYTLFENIMKWFVGMMVLVVLACAVLTFPGFGPLLSGLLTPRLPSGSIAFVLGVMGGVGGSVTMLSHGYWMREKGWRKTDDLGPARMDLAVAYGLTGLFGVAVMIVSAGVQPEVMSGGQMVVGVGEHLGRATGETARWVFLLGFWGAVFSSMLGVWQGVPYLFADFQGHLAQTPRRPEPTDKAYRAFLSFMAFPPLVLLFVQKPVWIVMLYAVTGALFLPFLAAVLLFLNNRRKEMGPFANGKVANVAAALVLVFFVTLSVLELIRRFSG